MEFLRKLTLTATAAGTCLISCVPSRPINLEAVKDPCIAGSFDGGNPGKSKPTLLWKLDLQNSVEYSPAISLGVLLIPLADNKLSIVSTNKPHRFAEIRFREPIVNSIAASESLVVVNTGGNRLLVVNWIKRDARWETNLSGWFGKPAIFENRVLWFDGLGYLRCFDIIEGKRLWDLKLDDTELRSAEACSTGVVVFADKGLIECLDLDSGQRLWSFQAGARIKGQPVILEDQLFFAAVDGTVARLKMSNGEPVWIRQLWSPVFGAPSCDSSGIYLGTNNRFLFKLDFDTGIVVWKTEIEGPVKTGPGLIDRFAVFVGLDHKIYFADKSSGEIVLDQETNGMITAPPVTCGNRLFVAGEDGFLYCYETERDGE